MGWMVCPQSLSVHLCRGCLCGVRVVKGERIEERRACCVLEWACQFSVLQG